MKEFDKFSLTITPEDCKKLSQVLCEPTKYNATSNEACQIKSVLETVNLIRQADILNNEVSIEDFLLQTEQMSSSFSNNIGNIYGKAKNFATQEDKIANEYIALSNLDASRFGFLILNIDNKPHIYENLSETVSKYYNIDQEHITLDVMLLFLKDEHGIIISDAQTNFLITQWNQSGSQAAATSLSVFDSAVGNDENAQNYNTFNFDKNNKLSSLQYTFGVKEIDTIAKARTGIFNTTADVSNLQDNNDLRKNPFIPQHSPKSVSIEYDSKNGLNCCIAPEVCNAFAEYATFKSPSIILDQNSKNKVIEIAQQFLNQLNPIQNQSTPPQTPRNSNQHTRSNG